MATITRIMVITDADGPGVSVLIEQGGVAQAPPPDARVFTNITEALQSILDFFDESKYSGSVDERIGHRVSLIRKAPEDNIRTVTTRLLFDDFLAFKKFGWNLRKKGQEIAAEAIIREIRRLQLMHPELDIGGNTYS